MRRLYILSRLRHFRGHGIHSPFVYGLKREVFMGKSPKKKESGHGNILIAHNVPKKVAAELEKLHNYCNLRGIEIVGSKSTLSNVVGDVLYVVTEEADEKVTKEILDTSRQVAVAVLKNRKIGQVNRKCLTIQRRRYTLFFVRDGLPAQTFKL